MRVHNIDEMLMEDVFFMWLFNMSWYDALVEIDEIDFQCDYFSNSLSTSITCPWKNYENYLFWASNTRCEHGPNESDIWKLCGYALYWELHVTLATPDEVETLGWSTCRKWWRQLDFEKFLCHETI